MAENQNFVSEADFVRAWQSSDNTDEVAEKTGLKRASCTQRATAIRKRMKEAGYPVTLKEMPRGRQSSTNTAAEVLAGLYGISVADLKAGNIPTDEKEESVDTPDEGEEVTSPSEEG